MHITHTRNHQQVQGGANGKSSKGAQHSRNARSVHGEMVGHGMPVGIKQVLEKIVYLTTEVMVEGVNKAKRAIGTIIKSWSRTSERVGEICRLPESKQGWNENYIPKAQRVEISVKH
jgi:hypothetical protein